MRAMVKRGLWAVAVLFAVAAPGRGALVYVTEREDLVPSVAPDNPVAQAARGRYLALAGDCVSCHTARGGAPYAGGRAVETPFGSIYAPNLTPDGQTGLGDWSADDFWRALHHGKAKDGRLLYPAFPYPNYTLVTREDSDALYAYFRTLVPVAQARRDNTLRSPYNQRWLLLAWRALYFKPGVYAQQQAQSAQWNCACVPIWCRVWGIATPATPAAIRWAAPISNRISPAA